MPLFLLDSYVFYFLKNMLLMFWSVASLLLFFPIRPVVFFTVDFYTRRGFLGAHVESQQVWLSLQYLREALDVSSVRETYFHRILLCNVFSKWSRYETWSNINQALRRQNRDSKPCILWKPNFQEALDYTWAGTRKRDAISS